MNIIRKLHDIQKSRGKLLHSAETLMDYFCMSYLLCFLQEQYTKKQFKALLNSLQNLILEIIYLIKQHYKTRNQENPNKQIITYTFENASDVAEGDFHYLQFGLIDDILAFKNQLQISEIKFSVKQISTRQQLRPIKLSQLMDLQCHLATIDKLFFLDPEIRNASLTPMKIIDILVNENMFREALTYINSTEKNFQREAFVFVHFYYEYPERKAEFMDLLKLIIGMVEQYDEVNLYVELILEQVYLVSRHLYKNAESEIVEFYKSLLGGQFNDTTVYALLNVLRLFGLFKEYLISLTRLIESQINRSNDQILKKRKHLPKPVFIKENYILYALNIPSTPAVQEQKKILMERLQPN